MRSIKYKAWDKVTKKMYQVQEMELWETCRHVVVEDYEYALVDPVLLQYTGFKDENGREIYEGDIVKCTDGAGEISELNSDTGIGRVEWLEKFGFWNISNIENGLGDIVFDGFVEVIGNIYENKELLEDDYCE